ncbi:amidase domain-containing protein [Peribacillus sp. SIMBA_075]|uniref:amidase domain-containing protein n=1 Tax=Peribacillus sp. SIMBA_075 TaxID=3085813 RepID=UPI00397E1BEA
MKKELISCFVFTLLVFGLFLNANQGSAAEKQRDDYTFGEVENILVEYLKANGYSFNIGSEEFTTYVIEQLDNDTDEQLAARDDYGLITAYLAEYLYRTSIVETEVEKDSVLSLNESEEEISAELDSISDITLGEMAKEIEEQEAADELTRESTIVAYKTGTVDVAAGRNYAKKYAHDYNPNYPEYSNDCTNFVSQILSAGGRRQVVNQSTAKLTSDNKYWYIKSLPKGGKGRSKSWSVVPDMYSHLTRTQKGYSSTSKQKIIDNAKAGDVIQFKKADADRYTHGMWVYSKSSSNLKLSGHTNDYVERSFNAITGYKTFRIVKM